MEIIFISLGIFLLGFFILSFQKRNGKNDEDSKLLKNEIGLLKDEKENKLPKNFELTDDFRRAFELMEYTDYSIFITGKAGTGKSTLIEYFRIYTKKMAVYLAPTGVAALNIDGKTIHSLFKFPLQVITSNQIKDNSYRDEIQELFRVVNVIIIDEISMARADLIEGVDYILKKFRDKNKPFWRRSNDIYW